MLTEWTLEHFKSAAEPVALELSPLTIFVGANSTGKSTVIQSILLTAQTLQSPVLSRPVILNGHIVRLGQFSDIVSNRFSGQAISVGFSLSATGEVLRDFAFSDLAHDDLGQLHSADCVVQCSYSFSSNVAPGERAELAGLQPRLEESRVSVRVAGRSRSARDDLAAEVHLRRSEENIHERMARLSLDSANVSPAEVGSLRYDVLSPSRTGQKRRARRHEGFPATSRIAGASLRHFLPGQFAVAFDTVGRDADQVVDALVFGASRYPQFAPAEEGIGRAKVSDEFLEHRSG